MVINPFDSSMATDERFARTYDVWKPLTSPFARPHPTAMTNPPVGTLPHPSRKPNRSLGTTPNPTRMANPRRFGSRDPARLLKNRGWDASSERKAIGNGRTRRPSYGSSTGCSPSGWRTPTQRRGHSLREAITLVSSIRSDDIDLNRTKSRDARLLLRADLDGAERGPSALASESVETGRDFESPFEEAVAQAMYVVLANLPHCRIARVTVVPSLRRRDACRRSDKPTVGERVLEKFGWRGRFIRIRSTDWIRNPAHQIERISARFNLDRSPEEAPSP